jgi:hypothetical protein
MYAVELGLGTKLYIPVSRFSKAYKGVTQTARWGHVSILIFQNKESRVEMCLLPTPTRIGAVPVTLEHNMEIPRGSDESASQSELLGFWNLSVGKWICFGPQVRGGEGTDHAVRAKSTRHFITTGFIIVLLCGSHENALVHTEIHFTSHTHCWQLLSSEHGDRWCWQNPTFQRCL